MSKPKENLYCCQCQMTTRQEKVDENSHRCLRCGVLLYPSSWSGISYNNCDTGRLPREPLATDNMSSTGGLDWKLAASEAKLNGL